MVPDIFEIFQTRGSSDFLERVQIRKISRRGQFCSLIQSPFLGFFTVVILKIYFIEVGKQYRANSSKLRSQKQINLELESFTKARRDLFVPLFFWSASNVNTVIMTFGPSLFQMNSFLLVIIARIFLR